MLNSQKKGYVYLIHSEDMNHFYIGSTSSAKKRFKSHSWQMRKGTHHSSLLQNACNKYGFDYFKFTVIAEFETRYESELLEQNLLDKYYKEKGCLNCSSKAIMATQCPDVISKRNKTLRSNSHRENARAKNKEWFLKNKDKAKAMLKKRIKTINSPEFKKANSDRQKIVNSTNEKKEAFVLRIKKHRDSGGKTNEKKVVRINNNGEEVFFESAREAMIKTPGSDYRGISACCTKLRNAKIHCGYSWRFL